MIRNSRVLGFGVLGGSALAAVGVVVTVIIVMGTIVLNGIGDLSWEFLFTAPTDGMTAGGIFPAIIGTAMLVIIMSIAGIPVGTITAIYLSEYADKESLLPRLIRFAVNTLAGVPAIVFGLFGLGFFIQFVGAGMDALLSGGAELKWS
ncbi:MAG: phosphate ABC transporter, permease protein PstA, partial [Ignavibacteria bacterium]|nr:phosphate ABC transporter, permease protein PstA [Ignavibacteria bacterium]